MRLFLLIFASLFTIESAQAQTEPARCVDRRGRGHPAQRGHRLRTEDHDRYRTDR